MTATFQMTQEQLDFIRELAYEKYLLRGGVNGHDVEDWLAAEQEVLNEQSITADGAAEVSSNGLAATGETPR